MGNFADVYLLESGDYKIALKVIENQENEDRVKKLQNKEDIN